MPRAVVSTVAITMVWWVMLTGSAPVLSAPTPTPTPTPTATHYPRSAVDKPFRGFTLTAVGAHRADIAALLFCGTALHQWFGVGVASALRPQSIQSKAKQEWRLDVWRSGRG